MISTTTILVAIVGSAIGGVVGSWLQIRHERQEAFRERMLEAADAAANSVAASLSATRLALVELESWLIDGGPSERSSAAHERARHLLDETTDFAGRVDLLYGLDSGIGDALRRTRGFLRRALSEAAQSPSPLDLDRSANAFKEAEQAYADFVRRARDAAMLYGVSSLRRSLARGR